MLTLEILKETSETIQILNAKIESEKTEINFNKMAIIDWSGRVYKESNKKVTDSYTGGDVYFNMSTNSINERRRDNRIASYKEEIARSNDRIEYFKTLIAKEERAVEEAYYTANPVTVECIDGLDDLEALFMLEV
jgi:hypothetical protein